MNENDKLIGLTNQNDILDWWDVFPQIKDKKTKDKMAEKAAKQNNSESFEQKLWKTADKLRKNIDAAEYKHIVLGLIFLKYISDAFEELHQKLIAGEGDIRKALVQKDLVDCIVMLPTQLFYNTGIPACLWFLSRYKNGNKNRDRHGEVLFIDASELGYMVNRSSRAFTEAEISKIADTYHEWKKSGGSYSDIKGFCKSANLSAIEKHNFVLTPGRYVGIPDEVEDGVSFEEKMGVLTADLAVQMNEGLTLDAEIKIQLAKVGFSLEVD